MQSMHQQVGGTHAFWAARVVPLVVVGHLQGQYLKQRATLYTVGWHVSAARERQSSIDHSFETRPDGSTQDPVDPGLGPGRV